MKISFWFDTYPGQKPENVFPSQSPPTWPKPQGGTRYRIDVEVPEIQPDKVAEARPVIVEAP